MTTRIPSGAPVNSLLLLSQVWVGGYMSMELHHQKRRPPHAGKDSEPQRALGAESRPYRSYNLEEEQSLVRALVNSMDFLRLRSSLFTKFKEAPSEPSVSPGDSLLNRALSSEETALKQILILFDLEFYFVLYNNFFPFLHWWFLMYLFLKFTKKNHY